MSKRDARTNSRKASNHVLVSPFRKLPKESSAVILRHLALTYLQGSATHETSEYGRQLLIAAGQSGDRVSSKRLTDFYLAGSHGFPKDKERSIYWWLRSERRQWSEQTPLYRYKLWKLSWRTGEHMNALV